MIGLLFLTYGLDLRHQIASGFILADATTFCWSVKQKQVVLIMSEGNVINSRWISTSVNITTDACVVVKNKSVVTNNERAIRSGIIRPMPIKACVCVRVVCDKTTFICFNYLKDKEARGAASAHREGWGSVGRVRG